MAGYPDIKNMEPFQLYYKVTVNRTLTPDNYPLSRIEDIFAAVQGGKFFSKLDLSQAYQQLPLDPDSKKFTTINTHKGLFQFDIWYFNCSEYFPVTDGEPSPGHSQCLCIH